MPRIYGNMYIADITLEYVEPSGITQIFFTPILIDFNVDVEICPQIPNPYEVYNDSMVNGWLDYTISANYSLNNTEFVHSGKYLITSSEFFIFWHLIIYSITFEAFANSSLKFAYTYGLTLTNFSLQFWANGGNNPVAAGTLEIVLKDTYGNSIGNVCYVSSPSYFLSSNIKYRKWLHRLRYLLIIGHWWYFLYPYFICKITYNLLLFYCLFYNIFMYYLFTIFYHLFFLYFLF